MRVLVNALSVTNLSGRHVLLGHLSMLAQWTNGQHDYFVLYHKFNKDICRDLGENVKWIQCPVHTTHWLTRTLWERTLLSSKASGLHMDLLFTPSGTAVPRLSIPQITFAQNPWCLVSKVQRKPLEKFKAILQRKVNEEAGDHFTPREVIRLMVDLIFMPDNDVLTTKGIVKTLYDPACGTGGFLVIAMNRIIAGLEEQLCKDLKKPKEKFIKKPCRFQI